MENILSNLNSRQTEAVKETEKPLLIIAGAGSGKTLTVSSKIAYLIHKGVKPENILALTFNQKAAEELKDRVVDMLGSSEDLNISTFHSFCTQIIEDNILSTKLNANFRVITETAQLVYLTKNINNFGLEYLEFSHEPYTLAEETKKFISRCKDEYILPNDLANYLKNQENKTLNDEEQNDLNNLKDILKIFRSYEEYKTKNNMLDFGDMLCIVHDLLKTKPLILNKYQQKFQYVIVDEFQDTNYLQLQIVNQLSKKHRHVAVVGDDDQSIYRFRGAYLTNIAEFKKMFPNHVEMPLEQNYRSTKKIIAVANTLIEKAPERTVKTLFTDNPQGEQVTVVETTTDSAQTNYVLQTIKQQLETHSPKDVAILCRRRASAEPIIKALRKHLIPFNFVGETGYFQEPIIKDVTAYLKVASNPAENNVEIARILHRFIYNLKPIEISKFANFASRRGISLYEAFDHLDKIEIDQEKFQEAKKLLDQLIKSKKKTQTLDLIHSLLFDLEFYKYEIAFQNNRNVQLLNQFYKFAEEFNSLYPGSDLEDFTDYVSCASNFEIEEENKDEEAITISTIHGAKGMQYPIVIIPDVVERKLPTTYMKDKFPIPETLLKGIKSVFDEKELHLQEERRLFYVAITRAKEKLIITYPKRYGENKTDSKPSRFLTDLEYETNRNINCEKTNIEELYVEEPTSANQVQTAFMKQIISDLKMGKFTRAIERVLLIAKASNKDMDISNEIISKIREPDYSILQQPTESEAIPVAEGRPFSVSQFITYKKCPRIYQYRYLMGIPEKPKYFFDFGASIHNVVEQLTRMMKEGKEVSHAIALGLLEKYWDPQGYKSQVDEKRDYEEAKTILKVFLEEQAKSQTEILEIEKRFETKIDDVKIVGRIDRIDKDGSNLIVVDYKTSKRASSENELKQDMQLLLYSIVVKTLYGKKPAKVGDWFLRSNEKKFIEVQDEAIETLKADIREIIAKIKAGKFDRTPGWECRNCDYGCLCE